MDKGKRGVPWPGMGGDSCWITETTNLSTYVTPTHPLGVPPVADE